MSPRLAFALQTATEAARATLPHFQSGGAFELKEDESPVTVADREAERSIRRAIETAYPGEAILGEEEGGSSTVPDRWVIDPIDGTKSFISGVPLYATLLSFERDFEPILGVCVLPALGEVFYAETGGGAFGNDRPCRVSKKTDLGESVISAGSVTSLQAASRLEDYRKLGDRVLAARNWTDAHGHMLVACGRIESMLDPIVKRWDLSAVSIIVREAGGSFTDFDGNPGIHEEAVSCAPGVKEAVLEAFKK